MASDSEKRIFLCTLCKEKCENESSAVAHMRDVHNLQLKIPKKKKVFQCHLCKKGLKRRSTLYKHIRSIHKQDTSTLVSVASRYNRQVKCPETSCSSLTFMHRDELRNHIEQQHGVTIEMCLKNFPSLNEFKVWKLKVERETNSRFIINQHARKCGIQGSNTISYYNCHRSGVYVSKSTGKKKSKAVKSIKINGNCPAAMHALVTKNGVEVKFWKTHFGHSCELDCLDLSKQDRIQIANKLKKGICFQQILDEIHDSLVESDVQRIHLLKVKDLYNISRAFKIDIPQNAPQKEHPNLNSWIDSMRALEDNCPVICYKDKEIEEMNLKKPELFLVVMTKLQQSMLQWCQSSIVCIDCIQHTHAFSYYLITLTTVDAYNIGCPLAFCVTNRINERTVSLFYNAVKTVVGPISVNLFMSVDRPVFYNEWKNVMGSAEHQILCNWDIEKSWRQKLEKLSVPEITKVKLYKKMRIIMQMEQYSEFRSALENMLCEFEQNESTKEFASFFRSKYLDRCELWAYCYRSNYILHSSFILDKIHKELYQCYMEGKSVSSLVRVLNLVIGVSRDKILEKSSKLPKEIQSELLAEKQLQVSADEDDYTYVKHKIEKVCPFDCEPFCSVCCICCHKFTCTCAYNFINLSTCRHIHASVNSLKEQCTHSKEQDKSAEETSVFQNVAKEVDVEMSDGEAGYASGNDSQFLDQIIESQVESNSSDIVAENLRSLLLQKVECFHHMVKDSTCKPEKYALINEHLDKIFELFTEE